MKEYRQVDVNANNPVGRLRVLRQGDRLTALYAGGAEGTDFKELGTIAVGNEAVKLFRITANPEGGGKEVDVRLLDASIKADDLARRSLAERAKAFPETLPGRQLSLDQALECWRTQLTTGCPLHAKHPAERTRLDPFALVLVRDQRLVPQPSPQGPVEALPQFRVEPGPHFADADLLVALFYRRIRLRKSSLPAGRKPIIRQCRSICRLILSQASVRLPGKYRLLSRLAIPPSSLPCTLAGRTSTLAGRTSAPLRLLPAIESPVADPRRMSSSPAAAGA